MIYLCSVYTTESVGLMKLRYEYAMKRTAEFLKDGICVFSPIAHCHELAIRHDLPKEFDFWEKLDYQYIAASSEVWVLKMPHWQESKGIAAEIAYAHETGKNVTYIDCDDYCEHAISTTFSQWRDNGEPDPHGAYYYRDMEQIAGGDRSTKKIAEALIEKKGTILFIMWLTIGKERLRWLSRKLYSLTKNHSEMNETRASLLCGDLTDDSLANAFFLSESKEHLQAGHDRIMWLSSEIETIMNKAP